jgi:aminoglycoside phosphotransferase (APT) family kinase protein
VYVLRVGREQRRLPRLTSFLPVPIPAPIGRGLPSADFPWVWSIFTWLEGKPAEFGRPRSYQTSPRF